MMWITRLVHAKYIVIEIHICLMNEYYQLDNSDFV